MPMRPGGPAQQTNRPWLHVPVGKLRDDRYLPLHPNLVTLIDDYRTKHVPADHPLLLPRENGCRLDRHTVTRFIASDVARYPIEVRLFVSDSIGCSEACGVPEVGASQ